MSSWQPTIPTWTLSPAFSTVCYWYDQAGKSLRKPCVRSCKSIHCTNAKHFETQIFFLSFFSLFLQLPWRFWICHTEDTQSPNQIFSTAQQRSRQYQRYNWHHLCFFVVVVVFSIIKMLKISEQIKMKWLNLNEHLSIKKKIEILKNSAMLGHYLLL